MLKRSRTKAAVQWARPAPGQVPRAVEDLGTEPGTVAWWLQGGAQGRWKPRAHTVLAAAEILDVFKPDRRYQGKTPLAWGIVLWMLLIRGFSHCLKLRKSGALHS